MQARAEAVRIAHEANALVKSGKLQEAIPLYERGIQIEESLFGVAAFSALSYGRALFNEGRFKEACLVYNRLFRWDKKKGELFGVTGDAVRYCMEYAIALSEVGQHDEARNLYHYGLSWTGGQDLSREPMPFTVIFEPDDQGVFWPYSKENLKAAALMVRAVHSGQHWQQDLSTVKELAPNWCYPYCFLAVQSDLKECEKWLPLAKLRVTDQEKALFDPFWEFCQNRLSEIRADSPLMHGQNLVPQGTKSDGAAIRERIACLDRKGQKLQGMFKERKPAEPIWSRP